MRKGTSLIWMNDYGLYNQCRLEAQRRGLGTLTEIVAGFVQQELGLTQPFKTGNDLYIACDEYVKSHNNTNIAGFMEYCCRKGLGMDANAQPQVVHSVGAGEQPVEQEAKKKSSIFDLNRDAR